MNGDDGLTAKEMAKLDAMVSWRNFFQNVMRQFLSVHFVITIIILYFWIDAVGSPIEVFKGMVHTLGTATEQKLAVTSSAIDAVTQSTVAISGIFTTVLGIVLGHYFGQRGKESADLARDKAEELRDKLVADFEEDRDLVADEIDLLNQSVDSANVAVFDAVRQLSALNVADIDANTPLGQYIKNLDEF